MEDRTSSAREEAYKDEYREEGREQGCEGLEGEVENMSEPDIQMIDMRLVF